MSHVTDKITGRFDELSLPYQKIGHEHCHTSEQSAQARVQAGGGLVVGAKALLLKLNRGRGPAEFSVFVLAGNRKLDPKAIKGKFRFASSEEMADKTGGVQPGAMPPFAKPIFHLLDHIYFDTALVRADELVGFNAADHCISLVVHVRDLILAASPTDVFPFSLDPPPALCDEIEEGRNYSNHRQA